MTSHESQTLQLTTGVVIEEAGMYCMQFIIWMTHVDVDQPCNYTVVI